MNAVQLCNVSKAYDGRMVIERVSLSVQSGERVALLGPSGCGKTTLLRVVAGLDAPDSGVVELQGRRVTDGPCILVAPERRHIGMVFQDLALWPHLTVAQHLEFVLRYQAARKPADRPAWIRRVLDMVRLTDRAQARPGELSGGQQQRVALARALVADPALLLMDEPLSNLDPELSLHMRREILRLHGELGFTLLFVTHRPEDAAQVASRVFAMSAGGIPARTIQPSV